MRTVIIILVVLIFGFGLWWFLGRKDSSPTENADKQQPLAVSQHSDSFNQSVDRLINTYYSMTNDFVNWDSTDVVAKATELKTDLDSLKLNELKDTTIYETAKVFVDNAHRDIEKIETAADLENKRRSLNSLTENLFNFLRVVQYDRAKLYLQECPMAFNDEEPGMWLSKSPEIVNPYLGTHHPRYGKGMLHCGETKETLNYTGANE